MAAPVRPQKAPAQKQAAPQKEAAPPPPPPEKDAKKRGPLVPAIIVAVALLGAAFMLKGGGGGGTPAATTAAPSATTAEGAPAEGGAHGDPSHVVSLDSITLNLADGRFLKLGLALQLDEGVEVEDIGGFGARALDTTIDLMGHYTYAELSKEGARTEAKEKLSEAVAKAYEGAVITVYFTEFVMQ